MILIITYVHPMFTIFRVQLSSGSDCLWRHNCMFKFFLIFQEVGRKIFYQFSVNYMSTFCFRNELYFFNKSGNHQLVIIVILNNISRVLSLSNGLKFCSRAASPYRDWLMGYCAYCHYFISNLYLCKHFVLYLDITGIVCFKKVCISCGISFSGLY